MKATSMCSTFVSLIYAKTVVTQKYVLNTNGIREFWFFTLTILKEQTLGLKSNWPDMGL